MYLKSLKIKDQTKKQFGLTVPDLELRSNVIGIVGKNGAGKTRLLNCIHQHLTLDGFSIMRSGALEGLPPTLRNTNNQMFKQQIQNLVIRISSQQIKNLQLRANQNAQNSIGQLINSENDQPQTNELNLINLDGLAYFTSLCTRLYLEKVNYMEKDPSSFKKTKLYQNFKSLKEKFSALIGKELDYKLTTENAQVDINGVASGIKAEWTLNNRIFQYPELSDGEKTLFWYILLLFLKENYHYSKTKNAIIILDEPELHLHPEAQYKLFTGPTDLIGKTGQLIIATHSLSILSCLNFDQIYLTESNEVFSPNSLRPFEALIQLLGDTSRFEQMKNFISNVSLWAYDQFMFNNFKDPEVIKTSNSDDPQFQLFKKSLNGNQIKMMDFGCGKGRLLNVINLDNALTSRFSRIDAFEPNPEYTRYLNEINCLSNVYRKLNELDSLYDIILLSNVLHEIKLEEIVPTLNKIKSCLAENGFLVILEDLILKKGEKPNDNGYLVFGANELAKLLKTGDEYFEIKHDNERYKDRIMCFVAPATALKQSNKNTLQDALIGLKQRSRKEIESLRSRNETYSNGRSYGFYAQQYLNAEFAIEENYDN